MTIEHPTPPHISGAFIFASFAGIISVCAPGDWDAERVEVFADRICNRDGWKAVDKSTIGLGSPTPNACNHDPERKHWFLMWQP
jgi:hypothetical protein